MIMKIAIQLLRRRSSALNRFFFRVEATEPDALATVSAGDISLPFFVTFMPRNPCASGSVVAESVSVLHILRLRTYAQIFAAIIEGVTISVIDNLIRFCIQNNPVHERSLMGQANIVSLRPITPFLFPWVSAQKLKVFWRNCRNSTVYERDFHMPIITTQCWEDSNACLCR